jgi:hypothetical protein
MVPPAVRPYLRFSGPDSAYNHFTPTSELNGSESGFAVPFQHFRDRRLAQGPSGTEWTERVERGETDTPAKNTTHHSTYQAKVLLQSTMASGSMYSRWTVITRLDGFSYQDYELFTPTVDEWLDEFNIVSHRLWENEHSQAGVRNVVRDTVQRATKVNC